MPYIPPKDKRQWAKHMEAQGLTGQTMHGQAFNSASKFTWKSFLTLRILRQPVKPRYFNFDTVGLDQGLIAKADERLRSYGSWKSYRESFARQKPKEGNFFLAKLFQDQTMTIKSDGVSSSISRRETRSMTQGEEDRQEPPQTPTKSGGMITGEAAFATIEGAVRSVEGGEAFFTPSIPGSNVSSEYTPDDEQYTMTIDEQIVNTALLNFLKAITESFSDITHHWAIHRNALHATVNERELYEARTDGYLSGNSGSSIRALVEVKAAVRSKKVDEIFMQESAQMVAWILNQPEEYLKMPGRYVRCSSYLQYTELTDERFFQVLQDRHEIYLNFAQFGDKYVQYLRDEGVQLRDDDPESFMTIFEVGPYKTRDKDHMMELGRILLALTLRADEDEANRRQREPQRGLQRNLIEEFQRVDLNAH